jgi:hypothetical protein
MAASATSRKTMLQLMSALDRVLLAGQRGLYADPHIPPSGPPSHDKRRDAPSLGNVALVSVEFQVYNRWRLGIATVHTEYTLQHAGVTTSQAHIKTAGGSHLLDVSGIRNVKVVTPQINERVTLHNPVQVGLVITTVSDEYILFNFVSNVSAMQTDLSNILQGFLAFLVQRGDIVPLRIIINPNCNVELCFDAGYTFAFSPIPQCYSPDT